MTKKKTTKTRRTTRRTKTRSAVAAVIAAPGCRLQEVPGTLDFSGPAGASVSLVTKGRKGEVLIIKAEYAGQTLVPPQQAVAAITFELQPKRHTLKLVLVFEHSVDGRGELREDCGGGDSRVLRPLRGDEPFQTVRLIGETA